MQKIKEKAGKCIQRLRKNKVAALEEKRIFAIREIPGMPEVQKERISTVDVDFISSNTDRALFSKFSSRHLSDSSSSFQTDQQKQNLKIKKFDNYSQENSQFTAQQGGENTILSYDSSSLIQIVDLDSFKMEESRRQENKDLIEPVEENKVGTVSQAVSFQFNQQNQTFPKQDTKLQIDKRQKTSQNQKEVGDGSTFEKNKNHFKKIYSIVALILEQQELKQLNSEKYNNKIQECVKYVQKYKNQEQFKEAMMQIFEEMEKEFADKQIDIAFLKGLFNKLYDSKFSSK